jgi:hypothetical protein
MVFCRLGLEELNALLAQGKRDFHTFFTECQLLGRREKISNNLDLAKWLICLCDFSSGITPI